MDQGLDMISLLKVKGKGQDHNKINKVTTVIMS